MEVLDDVRELQSGATPAPVLGEGTLLDDFVLTASQLNPLEPHGTGLCTVPEDAGDEDVAEHTREWDFESLVSSDVETERCASEEPWCVFLWKGL
jgi:hypothetical protein